MGFMSEIRESQRSAELKKKMANVIVNVMGDYDHPEAAKMRVDAAITAGENPDFEDIKILKMNGW